MPPSSASDPERERLKQLLVEDDEALERTLEVVEEALARRGIALETTSQDADDPKAPNGSDRGLPRPLRDRIRRLIGAV